MKKIGFIDYYLDEWHANTYPGMIQEASKGEMAVCYAYGKIDSPTGISNRAWGEKYDITVLNTIKEVIEKSDYLVVLSPDHPHMHEELCALPLKSRKRVYIDKTFAPDRESAKRIFAMAEAGETSFYSSSALFFADELKAVQKEGIKVINSWGPGTYDMYSIHQLEPIVSLMGYDARRVMFLGDEQFPSMLVEFDGGRRVQIANFPMGAPFIMSIGYMDNATKQITLESDYFSNFIDALIEFFRTGNIPVPHEETLAVISIRAAGIRAMKTPYQWVEI